MLIGFTEVVELHVDLFTNHGGSILVENLWSPLIRKGSALPDVP